MTFLQDNRVTYDGVVALVGNPNTGKSTIFNALTGLKQHTGNWPGKTVGMARGVFRVGMYKYLLVDLPGTYALRTASLEEKITRDFLLSGGPNVTVVVADACRLERNLYLILQVLEITGKAVVCLNMLDDARRRGICVDVRALEEELGVPVVAAAARSGLGLQELKRKVSALARGEIITCPRRVKYDPDIEEQLASQNGTRWLALEALLGQQKPGEGSFLERFKYCPV